MSLANPELIPACILYDNPGMTLEEFSEFFYVYPHKDEHGNPVDNPLSSQPFNPAYGATRLGLRESDSYWRELEGWQNQHDLGLFYGYPWFSDPSYSDPFFRVRKVTNYALGKEKITRATLYSNQEVPFADFAEMRYISRLVKFWGEESDFGSRDATIVYQNISESQQILTFDSYEGLINAFPCHAVENRFGFSDRLISLSGPGYDELRFFRLRLESGRFYFDDEYLRDFGPVSSYVPKSIDVRTRDVLPLRHGAFGWTDFMLTLGFVREGYMSYTGSGNCLMEEEFVTDEIKRTWVPEYEIVPVKGCINDSAVRAHRDKGRWDAMTSGFARGNSMSHTDLLRMRLTPWDKSHYL